MGESKGGQRRPSTNSVTLSQVAKRAGVHPGTVSRALQGDERVTPATQEHIRRIAKELNYIPNIAARVLAKGKTRTIAVATGSANEHHYAQILHYLEEELAASGYRSLILSKQEGDLFSVVNASSVDGVLAIDNFPQEEELRSSTQGSLLPCVYAGVVNKKWIDVSKVDIIEVDLGKAVGQAVQTMLDGGCQRLAYLVTNEMMTSTEEVRARVYTATLRAANQKCEIVNLEIGSIEQMHDLVRERLTQYIARHGCPSGLLCQNDEVAIVAHSVVKEWGLRIPEDVQIVGCDGLPYTKFLTPPLSTIVQPARQMCTLAWRFLQNRLADPSRPAQHVVLEAQLRASPSLKIPGN